MGKFMRKKMEIYIKILQIAENWWKIIKKIKCKFTVKKKKKITKKSVVKKTHL